MDKEEQLTQSLRELEVIAVQLQKDPTTAEIGDYMMRLHQDRAHIMAAFMQEVATLDKKQLERGQVIASGGNNGWKMESLAKLLFNRAFAVLSGKQAMLDTAREALAKVAGVRPCSTLLFCLVGAAVEPSTATPPEQP